MYNAAKHGVCSASSGSLRDTLAHLEDLRVRANVVVALVRADTPWIARTCTTCGNGKGGSRSISRGARGGRDHHVLLNRVLSLVHH